MDPKIKEALAKEEKREQDNIELIASENFVSQSILGKRDHAENRSLRQRQST